MLIEHLEERIPDDGGQDQVDDDEDHVAEVAVREEVGRDRVGQKVHGEHLRVEARPVELHPQVGIGGQDDALEHNGEEQVRVVDDRGEHERLVDVDERGHERGASERLVLLGLGKEHQERQGQRVELATDHVVAREAVGVDVVRSGTGGKGGHVLGHAALGDGQRHRGERPARDTEEVEHVANESDEHHAGERLGEVGDRREQKADHGEDVDVDEIGEEERDGQARQDGDDAVEPVLNEVGDHRVLAEEAVAGCELVDHADHEADHHGGEHAARAELPHLERRAAVFERLWIHAEHVGADARKARDERAALVILLHAHAVRDDEGDEEAHEAERIGAQGREVGERRNEVADNADEARNGRDHRERNDVEDRVRHDAEPVVGGQALDHGDEVLLDAPLDFCHHMCHGPHYSTSKSSSSRS